MTTRDRNETHPGYWPSPWPVECGGNRRQKSAAGRLDAAKGTATVIGSVNQRWNVMVVRRDPGEWYLAGTMAAFLGDPPFGWVQRIDPETLEPVAETPPLPCGDHVWCGAVAVHANGSLYNVNGSYLHRISPDCEVEVEAQLPVDQAHNGLLILGDGSIVTKDLRLDDAQPSTITRLDAETLAPLHAPLVLPEGSMGRIAADLTDDGEYLYVPGTQHLFRIRIEPNAMTIDDRWQPTYRSPGDGGLAWDYCLSEGAAWLMNNGDVTSVRTIFDTHPNGRLDAVTPVGNLSWQNPAPWPAPQRLLRADLTTGDITSAEPFDAPGGGIIAPPLHLADRGLVVCWDSINGGLAALDDRSLERRWLADIRATMQPVYFPESGEIAINDFGDRRDDVVVVDADTGAPAARVDVGSRLANGMFLTAGDDRDLFYCSTLTAARIVWT